MKEQLDREVRAVAATLYKAAGPDSVVIVLVADKNDMHMALHGWAPAQLGALAVMHAHLLQTAVATARG